MLIIALRIFLFAVGWPRGTRCPINAGHKGRLSHRPPAAIYTVHRGRRAVWESKLCIRMYTPDKRLRIKVGSYIARRSWCIQCIVAGGWCKSRCSVYVCIHQTNDRVLYLSVVAYLPNNNKHMAAFDGSIWVHGCYKLSFVKGSRS